MRIAICFSGQVRSAVRALPIYREFFLDRIEQQHTVHAFVHTWTHDSRTLLVGERPHLNTQVLTEDPGVYRAVPHEEFARTWELTQARSYLVEDTHRFWRRHRHLRVHPHLAAQTWSWLQSLELMQQQADRDGQPYDLVIKLRLDLLFTGSINLEDLVEWVFARPEVSFWANSTAGDQINDIVYVAAPLAQISAARALWKSLVQNYVPDYPLADCLRRQGRTWGSLEDLISQHRTLDLWFTILRWDSPFDARREQHKCHEYWVLLYQATTWTDLTELKSLGERDLRRVAAHCWQQFGYVPPLVRPYLEHRDE